MSILEKSILIGLGFLNVTRERAEKLVSELTERGSMRRSEAQDFVNELVERGKKEQEYLQKFIDERMKMLISSSKLPSREEFESLKERIAELERRLEEKGNNENR